MDASTVAVLLLATVPAPDSLQQPLLNVLAHPDSALVQYELDGESIFEVIDSEEAWALAVLLGTEPKSWSLPAIREEWCASPPRTEHRVRLDFASGANDAVVQIDLRRAWAVLGPVVGANVGYQDLRDRWNPLIGHLRATFPAEGSLKSVKPCPRFEGSRRPALSPDPPPIPADFWEP